MPENVPAVFASNVWRSFGAKTILRGIDLRADPGERIAITGSNGSGKTSLLRILATLLCPTAGDASIAGFSVTRSAPRARAQLGWAPALDAGFFPRLSGMENLLAFGSFRGLDRASVLAAIEEWRGLEPLREALRTPYFLCSSGMKQCLSLCRANMGSPAVLLLDEPTRGLDPETARAAREVLARPRDDCALILTTHSAEDLAIAGRELRLIEGSLREGHA